MCLSNIERELETPKEMVFFKLFRINRSGSLLDMINGRAKRDVGKKHVARRRAVSLQRYVYDHSFGKIYIEQRTYMSGFHGLLKLKDARIMAANSDYVVAKCRGLVRIIGEQWTYDAVVADTMTIEKVYRKK